MREEGWRREKLDPAIDYGKKLGSGPINFLFSILPMMMLLFKEDVT